MTREIIVAQKKDRLSKIINKGKNTQGIVRKLQREIRNLEQ